MTDHTSKRPLGLTLLALLLAWLSLGAVILAVVKPTPTPDLPWAWYQLAAGMYALTALPAAVGLWTRSSWAPRAFSIWSVVALLAGVLPALTMPTPLANSVILPVVILLLGAVILLWLGRYVRRSVQPAA